MEYIPAKNIVIRTKSRAWFGIDYNMNIYRGCCHGCIYCDSRSDCYRIDEFDKVKAKGNALEIIRDNLRRKTRTGVIGTGAMSDPYNPFEEKLELTRQALELVDAVGFGCAIDTKGDLITRDTDVLSGIAEHSPVICKITITAAEDSLSKLVEPGAPPSSKRFEAIRKLSEAGIFAGVIMMPVLPFIEDNEENITAIIKRAKECGAKFVYPAIGMTLRNNQREWYFSKLDTIFPGQGLREKYQEKYGYSYQCSSPRAKSLWQLVARECEKEGMYYTMSAIIRAYQRDYQYEQLRLF